VNDRATIAVAITLSGLIIMLAMAAMFWL